MKAYHPRRRTRGKEIYKQSIHDIKHRLSADVGGFITLLKEGNNEQITQAQLKVKGDFLKHSEEMQHVAQKMGSKYLKAVKEYLESIDTVIHASSTWIDDSKIRQIYISGEKLDRELAAA
ncbi:MAG TPA: hypothetical protein VGJ00_00220 [Rhabdochlamydiaceae bacterium]